MNRVMNRQRVDSYRGMLYKMRALVCDKIEVCWMI